eukprot:CAMPEP_0206002358 /NCGR_PEP_ID=MMETSP1464-20131121/2696_1 /ASSEMBLY_ACC=CAM_ASM_001124 /TAXON_ID=119497 /ORGANISM="Exanthemachrysis gayraliae, Strain RCC1523" /LENGTH=157 /DNA_ID=CAMNT_0053375697 /DNA_START=48 /DNA_END=519 /DNA_ORIENTATION=-
MPIPLANTHERGPGSFLGQLRGPQGVLHRSVGHHPDPVGHKDAEEARLYSPVERAGATLGAEGLEGLAHAHAGAGAPLDDGLGRVQRVGDGPGAHGAHAPGHKRVKAAREAAPRAPAQLYEGPVGPDEKSVARAGGPEPFEGVLARPREAELLPQLH